MPSGGLVRVGEEFPDVVNLRYKCRDVNFYFSGFSISLTSPCGAPLIRVFR